MKDKIKIEVSGRHVHISQRDIDKLFGVGYELTKVRDLSQPGTYAAKENVILVGKRAIEQVRVLGPPRDDSQVEISKTDSFDLGLKAPVRLSGDIKNTPGVKLKGPKGSVDLKKGVIIAERHLHLSEKQAKDLSVKDDDNVSVKVDGERGVTFHNIIARVGDYDSALHIDTDEGNAAGVEGEVFGELVR